MSRFTRATTAVSEVAVAAVSAECGASAMRAVSNALVTALGVDGVIYSEFTADAESRTHAVSPAEMWEAIPVHTAWTPAVRRMHLMVDHLCRYRPTRPLTLSEVISDLEWTRLEMAALVRPVWGRSRQLYLGVGHSNGAFRGWTFSRDGSDYSREDREIAEALRPLLDAVVCHYRHDRCAATQLPLTPRELTVLRLLAEGLPAPAIARRLRMSPRTAQKHLEHCYRKLAVRDKVSAVRVATDGGALAEPPAEPPDPDNQLF